MREKRWSKYHFKQATICFAGGAMLAQDWMLAWYICSFVIFQGIRTNIAKEILYFCDFSGGVWTPCSRHPSGSAHGVTVGEVDIRPHFQFHPNLWIIKRTHTHTSKHWLLYWLLNTIYKTTISSQLIGAVSLLACIPHVDKKPMWWGQLIWINIVFKRKYKSLKSYVHQELIRVVLWVFFLLSL